MPILKNPSHERFARELAKGKEDESYVLAGYSKCGKNACRLRANEAVSGRVEESFGRAAEKTVLTVAKLTEDLLRIARKAEDIGKASGLSVARAATMDAAKLNGLIIDRQERGAPGDFKDLDADDRRAAIDAIHRELERRSGGFASRGSGKPH